MNRKKAEGAGKSGLLFESKNSQPLNYITEAGLISEAIVNAADENGVELMFESKVSDLGRFSFNEIISATKFSGLVKDIDKRTFTPCSWTFLGFF